MVINLKFMKKLFILFIIVVAVLAYYGYLKINVNVNQNTNTASIDFNTKNTDYIPEAINNIKDGYKVCRNLCGDNICQQIVCQAIGCPCAETPATCPVDCK